MASLSTTQFKRAIKDRDFVLRERDRLAEAYLDERMDAFVKLLDEEGRVKDLLTTLITAHNQWDILPAHVKVLISLVIEKCGFDYAEIRGNFSKEVQDCIDYICESGFFFYVDYRVSLGDLWWATLCVEYEYLPPLLKKHLEKIAEEYADLHIENDLYCRLVQMETRDLMEGK